MKKQFILLFISLLTFNAFAQIEFKKGYYIDNNDQKIECLINNTNWLISSTEFQFKTNENSEVKIISIDQVAEYGINEESKFIRANVSIDNSSDNLSELSNEKNPLFEEKELFLKVLVQGKANLYLYQQKNATRFFYNIDTNKIEQLIFKRYKVNDNQISKNNFYKQQLWNTVKCENTMMKEVENVAYNENALAKFFIKYNACKNSVSTTFKARDSKGLFHFTIRPGINISSFGLNYGNVYTNQFFEKRSEVGYRFGIEAESILPFNKNKWSLLVEPSYQQFTNTKVVYDQDIRIDYKAIEIPLGLRYSVFLKKSTQNYLLMPC